MNGFRYLPHNPTDVATHYGAIRVDAQGYVDDTTPVSRGVNDTAVLVDIGPATLRLSFEEATALAEAINCHAHRFQAFKNEAVAEVA